MSKRLASQDRLTQTRLELRSLLQPQETAAGESGYPRSMTMRALELLLTSGIVRRLFK
jgi:hypothetical protein